MQNSYEIRKRETITGAEVNIATTTTKTRDKNAKDTKNIISKMLEQYFNLHGAKNILRISKRKKYVAIAKERKLDNIRGKEKKNVKIKFRNRNHSKNNNPTRRDLQRRKQEKGRS